jgi:polysaccharide biosynthesis transport protein
MSSHWESPEDLPSVDEAPPEFHLADYWEIVVKRRRLIALCVAVGIAGAVLASVLAKPTYKAAAILSVEKDWSSPTDIRSIEQSSSGFDPEFVPTQIRLMRSRQIAERVVRRLNLVAGSEASEKKSGFFRSPSQSTVTASGAVTSKALEVRDMTDATPIRGTSLVELSCVAGSPQLAANIANALSDS